MFRDIENLQIFPDYLKLSFQNTGKLVSEKNPKCQPKPTQTHKSKKHKQKTPNSPIIFFLFITPNWLVAGFRDEMILKQGTEGADLQQTVLKSAMELKHNCPMIQHLWE